MTSERLIDDVTAEVAGRERDLVDLCRRLVAADSANPPGDTRQVADVVAAFLTAEGLAPQMAATDPSMPNVIAVIDSGQPGPHVVLNVHLDTMPPGDHDAWAVPIFELTESADRLYGLGMGNMKGAVAAMCVAAGILHRRKPEWTGRVTFTAVADECVFGDNGSAWLLDTVPDLATADGLICGEGPGLMRLAAAEKGVFWVDLETTGEAGHASRAKHGQTATARMAALLGAVDDLNTWIATLPADLDQVPADDADARGLAANVGTVAGGTLVSQMATVVRAEADLRLPPGITIADIETALDSAVSAVPGSSWSRRKGWDANWTGLGTPFMSAFQHAVTAVRGQPAVPAVRLPASDASRWRARGVPAVCFGPQPTLSAGVDDFALRQDVVDCAAIYALAAVTFSKA